MDKLKSHTFWHFAAMAFGSAIVLTNLWAIASLTSWFDEAFMADVVFSLGRGTGFKVGIMPGQQGDVLVYGPVFFWLQQFVVSVFGFGEFTARITGLVGGLGIAVVIARLVQAETGSRGYALATFVLVIGDVSFNRGMASGRMDLFAVFFVVLSFAVARRALTVGGIWPVLLGAFAAVAFLTTPRSAFLLLGVAVLMIGISIKSFTQPGWLKRNLTGYGGSGLVFLALWGSWIAWIGGLGEYAKIYTSPQMVGFWGISLFRSYYDNLAIGTLLVLVVLYWRKLWRNEIFIGFLVAFLSFSLLAKQTGPYAGMVMPFVYAMIALALQAAIPDMGKPLRFGFGAAILLMFGLQTFVLVSKNANLYVNGPCRDHRDFHQQVISRMATGATVLSEFRYYFAVRRQEPAVFEVLEYNNADHVSETLKPNYILIDALRLGKESKDRAEARIAEMLDGSYRPLLRYHCKIDSLGWLGDLIAGFTYTNQSRTYLNAALYQKY